MAGAQPSVPYDGSACASIVENWTRGPIEGFTSEPFWDLFVEYRYDAPVAGEAGFEIGNYRPIDRSLQFVASRHVVIDGPPEGVKIVSFPYRQPKISSRDFSQHYSQVHGPLVAKSAAFKTILRRYVQYHVVTDSVRRYPQDTKPFDAIAVFWITSVDDAINAWRDPEYLGTLKPDRDRIISESHRVVVDERIVWPKASIADRR